MSAARIFNTPELFDVGLGAGTCGDIKCEFCGTKYNEGETKRGVFDGESIGHTNFAGMTICDCCFGAIESEILHRMPDILAWYKKILEIRAGRVEADKRVIKMIEKLTKGQ